jgi:hypothetical protein
MSSTDSHSSLVKSSSTSPRMSCSSNFGTYLPSPAFTRMHVTARRMICTTLSNPAFASRDRADRVRLSLLTELLQPVGDVYQRPLLRIVRQLVRGGLPTPQRWASCGVPPSHSQLTDLLRQALRDKTNTQHRLRRGRGQNMASHVGHTCESRSCGCCCSRAWGHAGLASWPVHDCCPALPGALRGIPGRGC